MTEQMTINEAWLDFAMWLPLQEKWNTLTRKEKQYLDKTTRAVRDGRAGIKRVSKIFAAYADGRYKLNEATFTRVE